MAHDPRIDLPASPVPVLPVTGRKDLQVNPADLEVIRRLVRARRDLRRARFDAPAATSAGHGILRSYKREIKPIDAEGDTSRHDSATGATAWPAEC